MLCCLADALCQIQRQCGFGGTQECQIRAVNHIQAVVTCLAEKIILAGLDFLQGHPCRGIGDVASQGVVIGYALARDEVLDVEFFAQGIVAKTAAEPVFQVFIPCLRDMPFITRRTRSAVMLSA